MGIRQTILKRRFHREEIEVLMVGLRDAGKSTVLQGMDLGEVRSASFPYNEETVQYKNVTFTAFDLDSITNAYRTFWRERYLHAARAFIFVVDSNDGERIYEGREELWKLMTDNKVRGAVLLVLANKQDLPDAMNVAEITDKLGLRHLRYCHWNVKATSATNQDGLSESLDWLWAKLKSVK